MKKPSEMWHKAWPDDGAFVRASAQDLERLIQAARADEREAMRNEVHSCGPTCTNAACVAVREAVDAERRSILKTIWDMANEDASGPVLGRTRRIIKAIQDRAWP